MEAYNLEKILPGWLDPALIEWYKFTDTIIYSKRSIMLVDNIIEFFKLNFELTITIDDINQREYISDVHIFINILMNVYYKGLDNNSMKKLLFYDVKMLNRFAGMYGLDIQTFIYNVIVNELRPSPNINYLGNISDPVTTLDIDKYDSCTTLNGGLKYLTINECSVGIKPLPKSLKLLRIEKYTYTGISDLSESNIEALYITSCSSNIILPLSLKYLNINDDVFKLNNLINLKTFIFGGPIFNSKLPPNVEYLYLKTCSMDLDYLTKLKALEVKIYNVTYALPKSLKYLTISNRNTTLTIPNHIRYLTLVSVAKVKFQDIDKEENINQTPRDRTPEDKKLLIDDEDNSMDIIVPEYIKYINVKVGRNVITTSDTTIVRYVL